MKEEVVYEPAMPVRQPALRRISWAAIFAGLIITLVAQVVLSVLGLSIGSSAINPLTDQNPGATIGIGAAVWLVISSIISLFLGGWVAGRMAGFPREGGLHGLVTWGAATLVTLLLLSSAVGNLLSGAGKLAGQAMPMANQAMASNGGGSSGAMGGVSSALQGVSGGNWDSVRQDVQSISQNSTPQQKAQLTSSVEKLLKNGGSNPQDRQAVVGTLVSQDNMSEQEANRKVDSWVQDYQQAKTQTEQKARQVGDKAAKGVSMAGWGTFVMLVLGAVAAGLGGASGAKALSRTAVEAPVPA
jgi:hypothetical protein